jgi:hypothetical protein
MRRASVIALVLSALLAGCGGSSGNSVASYRKSVTAARDDWARAAQRYSNAISASSDTGAAARATTAFEQATNAFASRLAALRAPARTRATQDRLVTLLRAIADDLGALGSAATNRDPAGARDAGKAVQRDLDQEAKAAQALDATLR